MLVVESFFSLMFAIMIIAVLMMVVKYRKEILEWMGKPPDKHCRDSELCLFDSMVKSGMSEDDAIHKVRYKRVHRKEIEAAIARDSDEETKTETAK